MGPILQREGLTEERLVAPEQRIPTARSRALGKLIFDALGDPTAGLHAGERFKLEDADLIGYLGRHSGSPLEALEALPRYARLLGDAATCAVRVSGGRVVVSFGLTGGRTLLPEAVDYAVTVFVRAVRAVTEGKARLLEARLERPRPRLVEPYRRALCANLRFGAEQTTLVFPEADLRGRIPGRDPHLRAILEKRAEDVLSTLPEGATLETLVRAQIGRRLPHDSTELSAVARDLGMSERTLRRRLREAGNGYRSLLDAVRAERAMALADERRHSVTDIAQLVGFTDATAFARAFRRWTGHPPHEYLRLRRAP